MKGAATEAGKDGCFTYTLPNGKTVKNASQEDLFDAFLGELDSIKQDLRELLAEIDRSIVHNVKELRRAVVGRGCIMVVRDEDLKPVDVRLQAREVGRP